MEHHATLEEVTFSESYFTWKVHNGLQVTHHDQFLPTKCLGFLTPNAMVSCIGSGHSQNKGPRMRW